MREGRRWVVAALGTPFAAGLATEASGQQPYYPYLPGCPPTTNTIIGT
jgi:hypothetical protein